MRSFLPLLGKEVRALFYSPIAYIIIGVCLLLMGYSFTLTLFINKFATLIHIFFQSAGSFCSSPSSPCAPSRRSGSAGTCRNSSAPVRESHVVLAKHPRQHGGGAPMIALTVPAPSCWAYSIDWARSIVIPRPRPARRRGTGARPPHIRAHLESGSGRHRHDWNFLLVDNRLSGDVPDVERILISLSPSRISRPLRPARCAPRSRSFGQHHPARCFSPCALARR